MLTIYESFDGVQFTNENDCHKHEIEIIKLYEKDIIGLNECGERIDLYDGIDFFFQESYFLFIKSKEAIDFMNKAFSEVESCPALDEPGVYYFNDDILEWEDADEKISSLYEEMEFIKGRKEMLFKIARGLN